MKRFLILLVLMTSACATEDPGISPNKDHFYFPTGMALDPVLPYLYVANSNADLRYNGGTLIVLDLGKLPDDLSTLRATLRQPGEKKLDCHVDRKKPSLWECPEEQFIQATNSLRLGDYPSEVRVSSTWNTSSGLRKRRLFVPIRGKNYLLWVDIVDLGDGRIDLRCNDDPEQGCGKAGLTDCQVFDCDDNHKVDYSEELRESLPDEPFGLVLNELAAVHVDQQGNRTTCRDGRSQVSCTCEGEPLCSDDVIRNCCIPAPGYDHLYISHLAGGEISFFKSMPSNVELSDISEPIFNTNSSIRGGFFMAAKTPGDMSSLIYAGSRVSSLIQSFLIYGEHRIVEAYGLSVNNIISPGDDVRGLTFTPGGDQLFVVDQRPEALLSFDMSMKDGVPKQDPQWSVEICNEPSSVQIAPNFLFDGNNGAYLAYVTCFANNQIYVIDTLFGQVIDQIPTGAGPTTLTIDQNKKRAFVSHFMDNTIGVIDLDPDHGTYNRMVMLIGKAETLVK